MYRDPIVENIRGIDHLCKRIADSMVGRPDKATMMQHWIVGFVHEREESHLDTFPKDIGKSFHMNRSSTSEMLQRMEKNDLIERVSVDYDARLKKVVLKENGYSVIKEMEGTMQEVREIITNGFSNEEVELLVHLMDRLLENGQKYLEKE